MKKLLLIGGSGGVGSALFPLLSKYDSYCVDSKQFNVVRPSGWDDMDIVINLAGVSVLCDLSTPHLLNKKAIEVNCLGAINILTHFLPRMREFNYGRIIFMSSVCAEINLKYHGLYSASKCFIDKLVKVAALENAEYGVTVNSIQLGYTGLGMSHNTLENMQRQKNKTSLKRFVTMEELYNAIEFIIETEYFTGQSLKLNGGIK